MKNKFKLRDKVFVLISSKAGELPNLLEGHVTAIDMSIDNMNQDVLTYKVFCGRERAETVPEKYIFKNKRDAIESVFTMELKNFL